jgi:hypothetical protein
LITKSDQSSDYEKISSAINILAWVAKGLLLKKDPGGREICFYLISKLHSKEINSVIPKAFSIIAEDDIFRLFSKDSFASQKVLFRQKFYVEIIPELISVYGSLKSTSDQGGIQCLLCISKILGSINSVSGLVVFDQLIPLLLVSLKLKDQELLKSVLSTITHIMSEKPEALKNELPTLIDRIIEMLGSAENILMVRLLGVKALGDFCGKFDTSDLLIHKKKVLAVLGKFIDDKKRAVRKEAANSRSKWYLLTSVMEK